MASSPFKLSPRGEGKQWDVYLRDGLNVVAVLYKQSNGDGYRFRLINYPHRMSKLFNSDKLALKALEKEVL